MGEKIEVKKFVIDRQRWIRGQDKESEGESYLLRESDGKMCCLGFYAKALGATDNQIRGKAICEDLITIDKTQLARGVFWPEQLVNRVFPNRDTNLAVKLYAVNDDVKLTEEQREATLKNLFKEKLGVDVKFVGADGDGDK